MNVPDYIKENWEIKVLAFIIALVVWYIAGF